MFTRGHVERNYHVEYPEYLGLAGHVRNSMHNGVPTTWAISRPVFGYAADLAPGYYQHHGLTANPRNKLRTAGAMHITPHKPRVEMDPSDPTTWQRQYRF
jgi:hypothetical protein